MPYQEYPAFYNHYRWHRWYDDISLIPWPTSISRKTKAGIDKTNIASSVAKQIVLEADEMLPVRETLIRFKGMFDNLADSIFLYIQPSLAVLELRTTLPPVLPGRLNKILADKHILYDSIREFPEEYTDSGGTELRELLLQEAEDSTETDNALKDWWRLDQFDFNYLKGETRDPVDLVDIYTVARINLLRQTKVPDVKIQSLEHGRLRFLQLYWAFFKERLKPT